jgi:thiamine kinase
MSGIDSSVIEELRLFLAKQDIQVKPISGGVVNASYCVLVENETYFLKQFVHSSSIPVKRKQAFEHQCKLAELGIAPRPLYLSKHHDFQLDTWLAMEKLVPRILTSGEKCQRLAEVMAYLHQVPYTAHLLSLRQDWDFYLAHNKQQLSDAEQTELERLLVYFEGECQREAVLCHNDLAFAHIVECSPPLLIDWEYSALASPYFDLAAGITINHLNAEHSAIVIKHYAQQRGFDLRWVQEKVTKMLPLVHKTNQLWAASVGTPLQMS